MQRKPSPKTSEQESKELSAPLAPIESLAVTANLLSLSKLFVNEPVFSFSASKKLQADEIRAPITELHKSLSQPAADNKKAVNPLTLATKEHIHEYITGSIDENKRAFITQLFDQLYHLSEIAFSSYETLLDKSTSTLVSLNKIRDQFLAEITKAISENDNPEIIASLNSFKTSLTLNINLITARYQLMDKDRLIRQQSEAISQLKFENSIASQESKVTHTERQQDKETIARLTDQNSRMAAENKQLEALTASLNAQNMALEQTKAALASPSQKSTKDQQALPKSTPWLKYALYTAGFLIGAALTATALGAPIGISLATASIIAGSAMTGSGVFYGIYRAVKNCFKSEPTDDDTLDSNHDEIISEKHNEDSESLMHSTSSMATIRSGLSIDVNAETQTSALTSTSSQHSQQSPTISRNTQSSPPRTTDLQSQADEYIPAADIRYFN